MATANHVLLRRITTTATVSSVTFDSIPQTGYTDLKIVVSGRTDRAAVYDYCKISFNSLTTNQTVKALRGENTTASSYSDTLIYSATNGNSATSNTFGSTEFYIPNYTSSNNKSVSIEGAAETNAAAALLEMQAGLWSASAAISTVTLTPYYGSWLAGCTFSLYGIADVNTTPTVIPKASGGDIVKTDGTYWYHTFTSSGIFKPDTNLSCDYLVVAGGGSGGRETNGYGGGGGAGGFRTETGFSVTSATNYSVTVGAGAAIAASTLVAGVRGSDSTFGTIVSTGGGGGSVDRASQPALTGGSGGGGAASTNPTGAAGNTPSTSPSQGNNGGNGVGEGGGGGGGASAAGGNSGITGSGSGAAGSGGAGTASSISGTSVTYAGGGGGSAYRSGQTAGAGGAGGGGAGSVGYTAGNAVSGTANTGGGGGSGSGRADLSIVNLPGTGGSGIVIIRYAV